MAVGRVFTAFSRKYTPNNGADAFVQVRFSEWDITMFGLTSGASGPIPNFWWSGYKLWDVTGDNTTNASMFNGSTDEPNVTSLSMDTGPGSGSWNTGNLLEYAYADLPAGGTERTYELRQGNTVKTSLTLYVPGKAQFLIAESGTRITTSPYTEITNVNKLNHYPVEQNIITSIGPAWHHENKFVGISAEMSEEYNSGTGGWGLMNTGLTTHPASVNNIPDLTFYVKEWLDEKNTHQDFKFRPDADASYSASASPSQQLMAGLISTLHTAKFGYGSTPAIQLNSDTMRQELINQGATVGLESQHLSYVQSQNGYVPDTHLSIIIQAENLGSETAHVDLRYANNANYAAILATQGALSYSTNKVIPVNGFAIRTLNEEGHDPCANTTLSYSLITQTHESVSGADDGELEITGTGGTPPYIYTWTGPNNYVSTGALISNLAPGVYIVKLEDSEGCTINASFTIDPGPVPCQGTITISQQAGDGCGMVDLMPVVSNLANGVTTYNWIWLDPNGTTISSGTQATGQTQAVNSATSPGLYTFQIDLGNSCIQSGTFAVVAANTPSLNVTYTDVTTNGGSNGTATAIVTGGVSPYTYQWSNGATTAAITGLTAGTYTINVTDSRGCAVTQTIVIIEPSVAPPNVSPLDVCMDLTTNKFIFTDNNNYVGINNILPYKIAITVKLINNASTIYTGALSSPDIFTDNDLAALRTYNATIKYGTNTDITILSGATLYNDVYEVTFDWNFSGTTAIEATQTILLNGLSIITFNALSISSSMSFDCNDDIINSLDTTNYSINNLPYSFNRTHSLSPPAGSSLSSPVLSSSASALNWTGLELGVWSNSITSNITWDMPGTINHQEYCIINNLTHSSNLNVLCYADPCVVTECIEKVRTKLATAECDCNENDIKKYRHILKRVGHLLAMYNITLDCTNIIDDSLLLYDIIDLTDCGCGCECGGCD